MTGKKYKKNITVAFYIFRNVQEYIKDSYLSDPTVCPIFGAQFPNPLPPSYSRQKEQSEHSLNDNLETKLEFVKYIHTYA